VSSKLENQLRSENLAVSEAGRGTVRIEVPREKGIFSILRRIEQDSAELISMSPRKESLEDIFLQAVRGPGHGAEATSNAGPNAGGRED
jgi:hypothetical protein